MNQEELLIHSFYSAFQKMDYKTMQSAYHPMSEFYDPVFQSLNAEQTKAMWQMLITAAKDLKISFMDIVADKTHGSCQWQAWYTFSKTGRPVHNVISASFQFKEGRIIQHHDSFDFWNWSRQALGASGLLLGWSSLVRNKVQHLARKNLDRFMEAHHATH